MEGGPDLTLALSCSEGCEGECVDWCIVDVWVAEVEVSGRKVKRRGNGRYERG